MIKNVFEHYYTLYPHPARLRPLSREELSKGMSVEAVDKYLDLVEKLYNACAFDVSDDYVPPPLETLHDKYAVISNIYESLIKHLYKNDAISDEAFFELHKVMYAEFKYIEHPHKPGVYICDSLDDFRLSFEYGIIDSDENIRQSHDYLMERYGYSICVRDNTPSRQITSADLCVIRFTGPGTTPGYVHTSYWEVKNLLTRIEHDIKQNAEEQTRLDNELLRNSSPNQGFKIMLQSTHYGRAKSEAEWYSIKRALQVEEANLCAVEDEIRSVFEAMDKPNDGVGHGATLFIYKGNITCHKDKHPLVPATAIIHDELDREVELNVEYCPICNRYMLNYVSYEHYRERHGLLIGKLKMLSANSAGTDYELASESPLKLCGYNVSETDGLSPATRQFLLAKIIHDGIMSKVDVIHYLEHFINRNGAKKENVLALEKWCDDLDFVHKYNKSVQPKTYIQSIQKY